MDVERLIGTMLDGALGGGGRKRSRGARRFLRGGRSPFINASTLLTLGGLVWGALETMQQQGTAAAGEAPAQGRGAVGPVPPAAGTPPGRAVPPPIPGSEPVGAPEAASDSEAHMPEGAARIIRLMVSAARADGTLGETERASILEHARAVGADAFVAREIERPTPLPAIVAGVTDEKQRNDLYVLAYGIVRADEGVSGAERIYLAQLASLLGLTPARVERLEGEVAARIDEAAKGEAGDAGQI